MGLVLGTARQIAVVVALTGLMSCERRQPVVIGFAFGRQYPGVLDVVHAAFAQQPGAPEPEIIDAARLIVTIGPPAQVTLASRFVAIPGLVGVVGHGDSRGSLAAAPVYHEARIPLLVPTATSRRLHTASPWVFMMAPDDSVEADFIAAFAVRSLHARTAVVFYDNDDYGIGLRDGLRGAFAARGVQSIAEEPLATPCGPPEMSEASILRATPRAHPPDLVVIAGRTRDAACVARRVTARVTGIRVIGTDGVEPDSAFYDRLGAAAPTFYLVAFWYPGAPGAASEDFARRFGQLVARPPHASEAMLFDAVLLLARATREAGPRHEAVRRYLSELGRTRPAYEGVTGAVAFGPAARRPLYMLRVGARDQQPVVAP